MSRLSQDPQHNYATFIEEALATGQVWGLKSDQGWVYCDSEEYEETDVIPFWTDRAEAQAQCCEAWADNTVEAIDIRAFVENWLPGMDEDGLLVGPNWNSELEGLEVEPIDLAKALLEADELQA